MRQPAVYALFFGMLLGTVSLQAPAQQQQLSVQVGVPVPNIVAIQLYVGQQTGFFRDEKLEVAVRYSTGAPQATQLVGAGQADVALATVEPLISGYEKGLRAKAFVRLNGQMIYYLAVPKDSSARRLEELKGAHIGVVNLGAASVAVARSMFRAAGIPTTPETFVPVGLGEQALLALRTDKVQALGLWSNAYYAMERAGHELRYFRHPTLADFGNVALIASDKGLTERRRELCGFSRAVAKASLFVVENPEAALRMYWVAVPSAKLGANDAEAVRNGMREILPQAKDLDVGFPPSAKFGVFDRAAFGNYMELLKEYGLANQVPPIGDVVTDALVNCMNDFDSAAVRKLARGWKK